MDAEIISIGTELTMGDTLDTNTHYITQKLTEIGVNVLFHTSVVDNETIIKKALKNSLDRVDLIICTGGLGPTDDDLTKEVVAQVFNLELSLDTRLKEEISNYFKKQNRNMPENNIKQAYIPKGSKYLKNEIGTAPGVCIKHDNKTVFLLPGPPKEMKLMLDKYVLPLVNQQEFVKVKTINTIDIGESQLAMDLEDIVRRHKDVSITTFAKTGRVDIKLVARGSDKNTVITRLNKAMEDIRSNFSYYIYGYDNIPIEKIVYEKLKEKNMKIAFCESCTGGLITSKFTKIAGVSEVLDRGIISYSNESKIEDLGVHKRLIEEYGAVSEEVALAMALGLLEKSKADIVLSTTGVAGPTGGTKTKPIGLVFIGIATKDTAFVIKNMFSGDRNAIQYRTYLKALDELRRFLI